MWSSIFMKNNIKQIMSHFQFKTTSINYLPVSSTG